MRLTDDVFSTQRMAVSEERAAWLGSHGTDRTKSVSGRIFASSFSPPSSRAGAEATFRHLLLVQYEGHTCLVGNNTRARACVPFGVQRTSVSRLAESMAWCQCSHAQKRNLSKAGFPGMVRKPTTITAVFQPVVSAKGGAFARKCLHATDHGHSFWHSLERQIFFFQEADILSTTLNLGLTVIHFLLIELVTPAINVDELETPSDLYLPPAGLFLEG